MFVSFDSQGTARLEDVDNFKAFKVVLSPSMDNAAAALTQVGRVDGSHLWIPRRWIEQHGRVTELAWLSGLDKMVEFASSAGWVDDDGAIRAHIETG